MRITKSASVALVSGLAAAMISLPGVQAATRPAVTANSTFTTIGYINPGGPMNPFNSAANVYPGLDLMPLGFYKYGQPGLMAFWPALATSWKLSNHGRTLTVQLNPKARWSNGTPVTPKDVETTMAIQAILGQPIGSAKTVGARGVAISEAASSNNAQFPQTTLGLNISPFAEFGKFLPSNVWSLIDASQYTGKVPAKVKAAKAALKQLALIDHRITSYAPPRDISAGPFYISSINTGAVDMTKNPYFYGANRIHFGHVVLRDDAQNQAIWNYLISGQVGYATSGGMTTSLVKRIEQTPQNHLFVVPSFTSAALYFNQRYYPYNMLKVRQALAYLISPSIVQKVAEPVSGIVSQSSDGLVNALTHAYVTPAAQAKLNRYGTNPAKAQALLKAAHFKKVNGQWHMPNGKPFVVPIYTVSGYSDWIEASSVIQHELNAVGIQVKPYPVATPSQQWQQASGGKLPVIVYFGSGGSPNPYMAFTDWAGAYGKSMNWLHLPIRVNVTGVGTINPRAIAAKLGSAKNPLVIRKYVSELALATNQYVPEITLWDYRQTGFINTAHYTDFPIHNKVVMEAGTQFGPAVGFYMDMGYLRPR